MTKKLTILVLILVAGCAPAPPPGAEGSPLWVSLGESTYVRQFTFRDGTRCVVMDGYQSGGIDCDWPQQEGIEQ